MRKKEGTEKGGLPFLALPALPACDKRFFLNGGRNAARTLNRRKTFSRTVNRAFRKTEHGKSGFLREKQGDVCKKTRKKGRALLCASLFGLSCFSGNPLPQSCLRFLAEIPCREDAGVKTGSPCRSAERGSPSAARNLPCTRSRPCCRCSRRTARRRGRPCSGCARTYIR